MTSHDPQAQPLPGLEEPPANITPMIRCLRRTLAALDGSGVLEEAHALELESMRLLARSAEMKLATGRASTIANDVELMLKIKAGIVGEETGEGSIDDQLRDAMAEMNRRLDESGATSP